MSLVKIFLSCELYSAENKIVTSTKKKQLSILKFRQMMPCKINAKRNKCYKNFT